MNDGTRLAIPRRAYSLRFRLIGLMTLGFAFLFVVVAVLLWGYARTAADRAYDPLLSGAAFAILERTSVGSDGPTVDLPQAALDLLALAPQERIAYAVLVGGVPLTGMQDVPTPPAGASADGTVFYEADYGGERMRLVASARRLVGSSAPITVEVRVGQTVGARVTQARDLFARGMVGLFCVSLLGLACVWLAVRQALLPLRTIGDALERMAPEDEAPLTVDAPREVSALTDALDGFIARLAAARGRTESFIADVAHQTRTSLSALHGHLTLAVDAPDEATLRRRLGRAEAQARRTIRLTNQLLSHAMVQHRGAAAERQRVDLVGLARDLLFEMLRDTELRDVSIGFEGEGPIHVEADPVSIREALRNLIENAVRHGPPDNEITVSVRRERNGIALAVSDQGPGIPVTERADAVARFRSLRTDRPGSGLGLAIAQAVAEAHGGALELDDAGDCGLKARLRFPLLAALFVAVGLLSPPASGTARAETFRVWSATDTAPMQPVLDAFSDANPTIRIDYREFQTVALHDAVLAAEDGALPDVVISPSMDLQVDLVNRGLARRLGAIERGATPQSWRNELFGFTFEPAVTIFDREALEPSDLPRNHVDLSAFVREREDVWRGRIGTYDIRLSGIGYLYATQDANQGVRALRLAETLGRADARTFCCTSEMAEAVARGDLVLAYNVIGSYALEAARANPRIGVHLFNDYNLVMARTAFVPRGATHPLLGERFVAFLLSRAGQDALARGGLPPVHAERRTDTRLEGQPFFPIPLGPQILVYLDPLKRRRFLTEWSSAIRPTEDPTKSGP